MHEHGFYIVVDGPDGVGKTTQLDRQEQRMLNIGRRVLRYDEPGGTAMADLMRQAALFGPPRHPRTEAMIFQTARVDQFLLEGEPALEKGIDLLASRSAETTKIIQGVAGGVDLDFLDKLNKLTMPPRYLHPDLFIVMVILDQVERERRREKIAQERALDVIERRSPAYQNKIYHAYLELAQKHGVEIVDASGTEDEVEQLVWQKIKPLYEERPKSVK